MAIFNIKVVLQSGSTETVLLNSHTAESAASEVLQGLKDDGMDVKGVLTNIRMTKAQAARVLTSCDVRNWSDI